MDDGEDVAVGAYLESRELGELDEAQLHPGCVIVLSLIETESVTDPRGSEGGTREGTYRRDLGVLLKHDLTFVQQLMVLLFDVLKTSSQDSVNLAFFQGRME